MQFEKFVAKDLSSALKRVRASLGGDAVVVSTRTLRRRSLFQQSQVEVLATRADGGLEAQLRSPAGPELPDKGKGDEDTVQGSETTNQTVEKPHGRAAYARAERQDERRLAEDSGQLMSGMLAPLRQEIQSIRALLQSHEAEARGGREHQLDSQLGELKELLARVNLGGVSLAKAAQRADRAILEAADVDPSVTDALLADLGAPLPQQEALGETVRRLKRGIAFALPTVGDFFAAGAGRRIALMGPTGVGKTTTVAKIAAHAALRHDKRVALISLDTYRIGAKEQLSHYAELIGVPFVTAHDRRSLREALDAFEDFDLVLIDTAGRGPDQTAAHCVQLRQMFSRHGVEVFITLAAATRRFEREEMLDAMGELGQLGAKALILTKLDEAVALGSCLSLTHRTGLPLAFVTSGQRVPEDLTPADGQSLASKLIDRVLKSSRFQAQTTAEGELPAFAQGVC